MCPNAHKDICNLKVRDIANNQLFLHRMEEIGVQLSPVTYMRLQEIFHTVRNNLGLYDGVSIPLTAFFSCFIKGSVSIRKIFEKDRCKHVNVSNSTTVITFFRLVDTPPADEHFLKNMLDFWGSFFKQ